MPGLALVLALVWDLSLMGSCVVDFRGGFLVGADDESVAMSPMPRKWRGLKGWSWLGELMIVSQMTACEGGLIPDEEEEEELEGHEAMM